MFTNARLARFAPGDLNRVSHLGYAGGQIASLVAYALVYAAAMPAVAAVFGWGGAFAGERIAGPVAALLIVALPLAALLVLPRDAMARARPAPAARRPLVLPPPLLWLLGARLFTAAGMFVTLSYFGVLPVELFGWRAAEMSMYGFAATVVSGAGAVWIAVAHPRAGPSLVLGAILLFALGATLMLSVSADAVLYGLVAAAGSPLREATFLTGAMLVALAIGPLEAGQRALVARVAPDDRLAEQFGYYVSATKAVAALRPLLAGLSIATTGNLRLSLAIALVLLALALAATLVGTAKGSLAWRASPAA
jgi:UMF1 family MFS transporter